MMVIPCFLALFMALAGVSGTVGATTLTEAQLAAHKHRIEGYTGDNSAGGYNDTADSPGSQERNITTDSTGSSASHTHSLSGVKSGSASSLPPYYALAFIMRVA